MSRKDFIDSRSLRYAGFFTLDFLLMAAILSESGFMVF
jgi:hypothetical protein